YNNQNIFKCDNNNNNNINNDHHNKNMFGYDNTINNNNNNNINKSQSLFNNDNNINKNNTMTKEEYQLFINHMDSTQIINHINDKFSSTSDDSILNILFIKISQFITGLDVIININDERITSYHNKLLSLKNYFTTFINSEIVNEKALLAIEEAVNNIITIQKMHSEFGDKLNI